MTQDAYNKFYTIIRPGGLLITDARYVKIQRKADAKQRELPIYATVMEKIGKPIVFNICMLGVLLALTDLVQPESVMKVIKTRIPKGFLDLNQKALDIGLTLGKAYKTQ